MEEQCGIGKRHNKPLVTVVRSTEQDPVFGNQTKRSSLLVKREKERHETLSTLD